MSSGGTEKLKTTPSLEDFEFYDCDGNLEADCPKSSRLQEAAEKITSGVSAVMSALSLVAEEQGVTVAIPVQAMAATAVGAITGSIVGGPPGLAIGLLTGAVIAYRTSPSKSKDVVTVPQKSTIKEIFSQMTLTQKKELIRELLGCLKQSNVKCLILEILKNEAIRNMALDIISGYFKRKMGIGLLRPGK